MALKVKAIKMAKAAKAAVRPAVKPQAGKPISKTGKLVKAAKGLTGIPLPFTRAFGGGGAGPLAPRRKRSRGMFMRKGRIFMGFTQKEIKNAMRRTYGGRRRK